MRTISLKLFMVFSLFFPAFWSTFSEDYKMEYYAVFTAAYGAVLLYLLFSARKGEWKKGERFPLVLAGILLLYNVLALFFNVRCQHWYGEQVNNTIAVLFFLCLCLQKDGFDGKREELIRFFLGCAVLSNVLSIAYYFAGYTSFLVCNNHLYFGKLPEDYYEARHYWLYSHKSDYALMLTLFLAAAVKYRKLFKNRILWAGSLLVFLTAMFLSHSWTGFGAAALVLAGGGKAFISGNGIRQRAPGFWRRWLRRERYSWRSVMCCPWAAGEISGPEPGRRSWRIRRAGACSSGSGSFMPRRTGR